MNKNKDIDVIFSDYFDTIAFRKIHSYQLRQKWAEKVSERVQNMTSSELLVARRESIIELGGNELEILYNDLINHIYDKCKKKLYSFNREQFYKLCYFTDLYMDLSTQYLNRKIVKFLRNAKKNGKKVYLVTDYYLPKESYEIFLNYFKIADLFDGIFDSSNCKASKQSGELYKYVITSLEIDPKTVMMIGDSKKSDIDNAKYYGLKTKHSFPILHKLHTNFCLKLNIIPNISNNIYKQAYKNTNFGEYAFAVYFFTKELYRQLIAKKFNNVYFFSRGGWFLKKCFDEYISFVGNEPNIESKYLKTSRKVIWPAKTDENLKELAEEYFKQEGINEKLVFVDEGWYSHAQIVISEVMNLDTEGFYYGIIERPLAPKNCIRHGIVFDGGDLENSRSKYYGVLRSNCTFLEQIFTAPHGSIESYQRDSKGTIECVENWENIEKELYKRYTIDIQESMKTVFDCLCSWNVNISEKDLAKKALKTLLIANNSRKEIINFYNKSYYNNFESTSTKTFGDVKKLIISITDLIVHPDNYIRYLCKIKEIQFNNRLKNTFVKGLTHIIYLYCLARL